MNAGRLCCPTQQFYHPADAELVEKIEDEEGFTHVAPRFSLNRGRDSDEDSNEEKPTAGSGYKGWWSCCGEGIACTGCQEVHRLT